MNAKDEARRPAIGPTLAVPAFVVEVKERPILFSAPMSLAIRAGRKTQTRRLLNPQPIQSARMPPLSPKVGAIYVGPDILPTTAARGLVLGHCTAVGNIHCMGSEAFVEKLSPWRPGQILYVKENTWLWCEKLRDGDTATGRPKWRYIPLRVPGGVVYRADEPKPTERLDDDPTHEWRMKIGRFMPRWAARTRAVVTTVRVQRLQSISSDDCFAEGIDTESEVYNEGEAFASAGSPVPAERYAFTTLRDSINGARPGCAWADDPWAWAVGFERI